MATSTPSLHPKSPKPSRSQRHTVLLGGGGFSDGPDHTRIDSFTLALTANARPRVCFIPTASGDNLSYIEKFRAAFPPDRARASFISLFGRSARTLASQLDGQDVIYVGGGSTANLLALWRLHGLDKLVLRAHRAGAVLTGVSAGMLCWFQACLTDSFGPVAPMRDGLGLLEGSACPHYDSEKDRRPTFERLIATAKLPPGVACDDHAAAHFVNGKLLGGVSEKPGARVYLVKRVKVGRTFKALSQPIPTRHLTL
jgi:peptidase E